MGQIDSTGRVLGAAPKIWSQIPYVSEKLFFILLTRVISCNQIQSLYGSVQKGVMTCDNAFAKSEGAWVNMCVFNSPATSTPTAGAGAQCCIGFHQLFGDWDIRQVGKTGRLNSLLSDCQELVWLATNGVYLRSWMSFSWQGKYGHPDRERHWFIQSVLGWSQF